jgi:hypothetical protein
VLSMNSNIGTVLSMNSNIGFLTGMVDTVQKKVILPVTFHHHNSRTVMQQM